MKPVIFQYMRTVLSILSVGGGGFEIGKMGYSLGSKGFTWRETRLVIAIKASILDVGLFTNDRFYASLSLFVDTFY